MSSKTAALAGKRVLVTGGAGFIGSTLVDHLLSAGCDEILVVDNMLHGRLEHLAEAVRSDKVRVIDVDIRDRSAMARLVAGIDTVFHQATLRAGHCVSEPRLAMEVMADATFDLLEQCVASRVRKVVLASSASVCGMAEGLPSPEGRRGLHLDRTLHGVMKSFCEGLLRAFRTMYGQDAVALRYFDAYGPRMDIHGPYTEQMIRWIERIEAATPPIIYGDGLQTMDLVHVDDIARANILAATTDVSGVALDIGSGLQTSSLDLARMLAGVMGRGWLAPVHMADRGAFPLARPAADPRPAEQLLGFRADRPLETGLRELVAWWRQASSWTAAEPETGEIPPGVTAR
ncbi:SDR family NAD(P)-dependent oxidoreductase [Inquilinus limosus]|uniref:SDR family NAD(P)-dependent oxidoreductase n=1 Tax=Inquilinus limosus TaxID=171674 RepID=UPI000402C99E|nr:SDR family NAD(P)-dependent oxidoreductase [Inquilinus limosus]